MRYKRKFIGIDNEKEYLDTIAIPRLKYEIENKKLYKSFEYKIQIS